MKKLKEEISKIVENYYPAFEGEIGKENKDCMADAILTAFKEVLPKEKASEHEEEDCGFCIALDEGVACETYDAGYNAYRKELEDLL